MRKILLTGAAITGLLVTQPVRAEDNEAILAQLKAMQAQMQQMQREMNSLKDELAKTKAQAKASQKVTDEVKAAKMSTRPESDVKISMVPAPKFETADGAYSFKVGGFAQVDAGMVSDDRRDHPDGTNIRRARLSASGTIARDFNYKLENDFAGNASALTDVYLEYVGFKPFTDAPLSLMVGQFKEPFGLETLTSDLFTTFNERASTLAFSPDRKIGAMLSTYGTNAPIGAWTVAFGGFGAGTSTTTSTDDEARDLTGRITWAPVADKTRVLHLGVAGSHRIPDSATDIMAFSSRAENQLSTNSADLTVNTGNITAVNDVDLLGFEAAGVYGPFSVQGEYVKTEIDRKNLADQSFDGFYVEASYFLTGESRNYSTKTAKFDRVTPKWPFSLSQKQWGAWQVAARYSDLDLNSSVIHGGEMKNLTLGLRWLPYAHVSINANYIRSNSDGFSVTPNDDPSIWLLRTQFDF